jgi:hypothetical protein
MRVANVDVRENERGTALTADVVSDGASPGAERLEFLYRDTPAASVSTPGDALLAAVLIPAMARREDVGIEAPVSKTLLANAAEIVNIWSAWRRRWRASTIDAQAADRGALEPTEIAACFSGGLDSYYTVLAPREERITTLLSLHGWSVPGQAAHLDHYMDTLAGAASRLGMRHVVVETNVFGWSYQYVPHTARLGTPNHGGALAAMALGLGSTIRRCYIASSEPFLRRAWGSHPRVDPLWSTETLEVVHDAPLLSRIDKFELVAQSDVALDTLHVCLTGRDEFENCRVCDKCQAAALMLHLAGALDRSKTLGPVTPETIRRVRIGIWHHHIWAELRRKTPEPELKRAITIALAKAKVRRMARPLGSLLRRAGLR